MAEGGASPSSDDAKTPWWHRHNVDLDFDTAEAVCHKIFGITLKPEDSEDQWHRKTSFKLMTDIIVDTVTTRVPTTNANLELESLSLALGVNRAYCSYNYEDTADIHTEGFVNFEHWCSRWKQHFSLIIMGHYDINNLEDVIVGTVPSFMHNIETSWAI